MELLIQLFCIRTHDMVKVHIISIDGETEAHFKCSYKIQGLTTPL